MVETSMRAGLGLRKTEETGTANKGSGVEINQDLCLFSDAVGPGPPLDPQLLCPRALQDAWSGEPLVFPAGVLTRHSLLYTTPVTIRSNRGLTPPRRFIQALLPAWQQCQFSSTFLLRKSLRWLSRTNLKRQGWSREVNKHEVMMWFF